MAMGLPPELPPPPVIPVVHMTEVGHLSVSEFMAISLESSPQIITHDASAAAASDDGHARAVTATEDEASVAQGQSAAGDATRAGGPTPAEDAGSIPAEASARARASMDQEQVDNNAAYLASKIEEDVTAMSNRRMESLPPAREHVLDNGNLLIEGMEMQRATRVLPPSWQAQQAAERSQQAGAEEIDVESLPPIQRD